MSENNNDPKRPRGRPPTRTNAEGALGHINIKCELALKGAFVLAARDAGASLTEWMLSTCREAVPGTVWQRIAERDRLRQVGKFLDRLDSREQTIIIRRYGLDHEHEPQTLKEVGSALGVTKERVRQIEAKALEKLREAATADGVLPELE
jgi:DNA-directed RNA polymerase specialized sigma24 family protein